MTANDKSDEPREEKNEVSVLEEMNLDDSDHAAYLELSHELDEINECLDALEKQNDTLHEELHKLLEESKQIRAEIREMKSTTT